MSEIQALIENQPQPQPHEEALARQSQRISQALSDPQREALISAWEAHQRSLAAQAVCDGYEADALRISRAANNFVVEALRRRDLVSVEGTSLTPLGERVACVSWEAQHGLSRADYQFALREHWSPVVDALEENSELARSEGASACWVTFVLLTQAWQECECGPRDTKCHHRDLICQLDKDPKALLTGGFFSRD